MDDNCNQEWCMRWQFLPLFRISCKPSVIGQWWNATLQCTLCQGLVASHSTFYKYNLREIIGACNAASLYCSCLSAEQCSTARLSLFPIIWLAINDPFSLSDLAQCACLYTWNVYLPEMNPACTSQPSHELRKLELFISLYYFISESSPVLFACNFSWHQNVWNVSSDQLITIVINILHLPSRGAWMTQYCEIGEWVQC